MGCKGVLNMNRIKVQTSIKEIYMRLPALNYTNEVVFSNNVPQRALNKIVNKMKTNGINVDLIKAEDMFIIRRQGNARFDVYLLNSLY
jgi:hypothetical protein